MEFKDKKRVRIGKNVTIDVGHLEVGDGVLIADNVTLKGPRLSIGDYTLIRENTQIIGKKPCQIGMNCWIGQGCIIDASDEMKIGNGVGIGAHSQLWTHMRFGDPLQGCRWESTKPMVVEDDVWFVGHCLVSPIHAKAKSMAMLGSLVTKDMEANRTYAGTPAKDMTDKLGSQYSEISVEQKMSMMNERLQRFFAKKGVSRGIEIVTEWPKKIANDVTYFNVSTREYTKRRSDLEMDFMLDLLVTIKFYPVS